MVPSPPAAITKALPRAAPSRQALRIAGAGRLRQLRAHAETKHGVERTGQATPAPHPGSRIKYNEHVVALLAAFGLQFRVGTTAVP
jgi:hypothetical protein